MKRWPTSSRVKKAEPTSKRAELVSLYNLLRKVPGDMSWKVDCNNWKFKSQDYLSTHQVWNERTSGKKIVGKRFMSYLNGILLILIWCLLCQSSTTGRWTHTTGALHSVRRALKKMFYRKRSTLNFFLKFPYFSYLILAIGPDGLCCQSREFKEWHGCRSTKGVTKGKPLPCKLWRLNTIGSRDAWLIRTNGVRMNAS